MCNCKPKHCTYPHPLLSHGFSKYFFFSKLEFLPSTSYTGRDTSFPHFPLGVSYKDSIAQASDEDLSKGNLQWIPARYLAKLANLKVTVQRANILQANKDKSKGIIFTP